MGIIVLAVLLALSFAANVYFVVYLAILFRIFEERGFNSPVVQQAFHTPLTPTETKNNETSTS